MPALPDRRSPCRIDPAKGPRRHRCSAFHAALVEQYRLARQSWEEARDAVALGYDAEEVDYARDHPPPTFGAWLRVWAGAAEEAA